LRQCRIVRPSLHGVLVARLALAVITSM